MASAHMSKRTHCTGCGYALKALDGQSDHCNACRDAQAKGRTAWGKRMLLVRKMRRAKGMTPALPADAFKGFREEK